MYVISSTFWQGGGWVLIATNELPKIRRKYCLLCMKSAGLKTAAPGMFPLKQVENGSTSNEESV